MTVIGIVLILIAALVLLAVLLGGSDERANLDLGVVEVTGISTMGVFLIGAATVLIFVAGLELLRSGLRRSLRRRRELKHARSVVADHERRDGDRSTDHADDESTKRTDDRTDDRTGDHAAEPTGDRSAEPTADTRRDPHRPG